MLRLFVGFFKDALNYMYPRRKYKAVPRQTINYYKMGNEVTEDERILMLLNKARNPQAARQLMERYNVKSAAEIIPILPKKRRRSFKSRLKQLLLKLDGHTPGDHYRAGQDNPNRL